jgi:hypothetical protein
MLAVLYLLQYMDKSNIGKEIHFWPFVYFANVTLLTAGNAKIEGLTSQLNLSATQFTWVLSIFYIPYGLMEIPSNVSAP